ncbi:hypothetical protein X892_5520 [Burkholderia pseudomallei MSHR3960]|nr:hypothetical protein X892_5520 [Burkholderia pseudomallei MSHR3960]
MRVGGQHAEEPVAERERERRAAIDLARLDEARAARVHVEALIARARLAVHGQRLAVREREALREAAARAFLHDVAEQHVHLVGDLRRQQRPRLRGRAHEARLVRRAVRELERRDPLVRHLLAVVRDQADELRERGRLIARRADGGRVRRRQVIERIAERAPRFADRIVRAQLDHPFDAAVLRRVIARLEEPRIRRDPCVAARLLHVVERRGRVPAKIRERPQRERVHARDVAAIVQVEALDRVLRIELVERVVRQLRGGRRAVQRRAHLRVEPRARLLGRDAAQHRRDARRRFAHGAEHRGERVVVRLARVSRVEALHVHAALGIDETHQVALPLRGIVEPRRRRPARADHLVMDDVAHQPHEHEVHRVLERDVHGQDLAVVRFVEVREALRAAAGVERLARARRILALDGRGKHRPQRALRRVREIVERPARERVGRIGLHLRELGRAQVRVARVQLGDDLQIRDDRAQLRGRAEVQARALVDVERLVDAVGLHAQQVRAVAALVQREAVLDLRRIVARAQHLEAVEAGFARAVARRRAREARGDRLLHSVVQRVGRAQIEPVELVDVVDAERAEQVRARGRHRLARDERARVGGGRHRAALDVRGKRRVAQRGRDHAARREQAQVAVGEALQRRVAAVQEERRRALRDHQRQHLPERDALRGDVLGRRRRGEQPVHFVEIAPVPGGEAVADARDFAHARARGERHRVQVMNDDRVARGHRLRAVQVGAHRCRRDLPQLLRRRRGAAVGRMAEFLELRRERAAAGRRLVAVHEAQPLIGERAAEAPPVDRRIAVRLARVEQIAILDEEQRLHDERRNRVEIDVGVMRVDDAEQRRARRIDDRQAGLVFFAVRQEQALVGEREHPVGHARLRRDDEAARQQPLLERRQQRVAEAQVVRAVVGEADAIARAFVDAVADVARQFRQKARL